MEAGMVITILLIVLVIFSVAQAAQLALIQTEIGGGSIFTSGSKSSYTAPATSQPGMVGGC